MKLFSFMAVSLTHFWQMFPFYTSWKQQKSRGVLVFSAGIKWEHWTRSTLFSCTKWKLQLKQLSVKQAQDLKTILMKEVLIFLVKLLLGTIRTCFFHAVVRIRICFFSFSCAFLCPIEKFSQFKKFVLDRDF